MQLNQVAGLRSPSREIILNVCLWDLECFPSDFHSSRIRIFVTESSDNFVDGNILYSKLFWYEGIGHLSFATQIIRSWKHVSKLIIYKQNIFNGNLQIIPSGKKLDDTPVGLFPILLFSRARNIEIFHSMTMIFCFYYLNTRTCVQFELRDKANIEIDWQNLQSEIWWGARELYRVERWIIYHVRQRRRLGVENNLLWIINRVDISDPVSFAQFYEGSAVCKDPLQQSEE